MVKSCSMGDSVMGGMVGLTAGTASAEGPDQILTPSVVEAEGFGRPGRRRWKAQVAKRTRFAASCEASSFWPFKISLTDGKVPTSSFLRPGEDVRLKGGVVEEAVP